MLEHLPGSPKELLENMRACLEPDGFLYVDVPNIAWWDHRMACSSVVAASTQPLEFYYGSAPPFLGHHREYTVEELETVLRCEQAFDVLAAQVFNYTPRPRGGLALRIFFAAGQPAADGSCRAHSSRNSGEVILAVLRHTRPASRAPSAANGGDVEVGGDHAADARARASRWPASGAT